MLWKSLEWLNLACNIILQIAGNLLVTHSFCLHRFLYILRSLLLSISKTPVVSIN